MMTSKTQGMLSENVTARFCDHFSIIPSLSVGKMCTYSPEIKLV